MYTSEEQGKIKELRERVQDIIKGDEELNDDSFLIRWLRARNLDLKKAEEMLRASMEWRQVNQVDGIIEREPVPEEVTSQAPIAWCGNTPEGIPIFLCLIGTHDMRKYVEFFGREKCERMNITNMEKIMRIIKKSGEEHGTKVTQFVEIMDFEGFSYKQMATKLSRDFMIETNKMIDANYPEVLKHAIVINAPKIFAILFAMLKPIIPKHTLEKCEIYGPDKSKWLKAIGEKYPMDKIPPHWGGTLKGVDKYCSGHEIWMQGPPDFGEFFKRASNQIVKTEEGLWKVTINARAEFVEELHVMDGGSVIEWKFKTEGYDIGFKVTLIPNVDDGAAEEDREETQIEYSRVDSHKSLQEGSLSCKKPGVYRLLFDNSYSFLKSKVLCYSIEQRSA